MILRSGQAAHTKATSRISVVMPVYNGGPDLDQCLAAIAASSYPAFECILVDDVSTDGVIAPAARRHGARVITLEKQSGPGLARNRGASEARGDILFFVDADVLLHPDALAIAASALESDPGLSAVFGSYDDQPGHTSFLSQYRNLFHHWVHQSGKEEASTFWAGCGAIRRQVFIEIGGFHPDYGRPSIEDIELGSRLRRSGHKIRLEKTMLGKHLKRWKFWNLMKTDILHRGVPWMRLVLREKRAPKDLNLGVNSRIATILAGLLGLSVLVFPFIGHLAALLPAGSILCAAALSVWFSKLAYGRGWISPFALLLLMSAPITAYVIAPDPWAPIPLALILALVCTHLAFYRYVAKKRSVAFAIAVVPMQVLFFLGCTVAAFLGLFKHHFYRKETSAGTQEPR